MDPGMLPACRECRKQQTVGIAARKGMDMIRIVPIQEYFDSNCYFYIDDISRCGFLIDPGAEPEKLLDLVRREEWRIEKILITHGHIDHIGAVNAVLREIPVPVYAHRMAEYFMQDEELNLSSVFGPPIHIEGLRYLEDGDEICLDSDPSFSLKVIYAPGHTVDSIVLYSEKDRAAFVGDSIYKGCIGDYQYPGGDYELLLKNVKEKILTLPDDTVLYSGHSDPTTVGEEKPLYRSFYRSRL